MYRLPLRAGLLPLLTVAVAAAAAAQAPPPAPTPAPTPIPTAPGRFVDRVEVVLGNVDVTVLDADGKPVSGLERDDFVLLVDGRPTEISNFAPFADSRRSGPGSLPRGWGEEEDPAQGQVLVVFIDNENSTIFNRNHALKRIRDLLDEFLVPPNRAAVVTNDRYLRFACPLTSDAGEVMRTVDALLSSSSGVGAAHTFLRRGEEQIRDIAAQRQIREELRIDQAMMSARVNASQLERSLRATVGTFKELIRMLSGVPGRKSVLYLSDGVPMSPGIELFYLITELLPARMGETDFSSFNAAAMFDSLVKYAAAAEVTLYTLDARGLELPSGREAERQVQQSSEVSTIQLRNYQDPLILLASQTGGVSVVNTNAFADGLERIREAIQTYYALGFSLEPAGRDVLHQVRVGLRDHPDYRLRYRPSFVERTRATQVADRTMAALAFDFDENGLGIGVEPGAARPAAEDTWVVPVTIRVPLESVALVPRDGTLTGSLRIFMVARGDDGTTSKLAEIGQEIRIPETARGTVKNFDVSTEFQIGSGAYRISVGVLDEVGAGSGFAVARTVTGGGSR